MAGKGSLEHVNHYTPPPVINCNSIQLRGEGSIFHTVYFAKIKNPLKMQGYRSDPKMWNPRD